MRILLIIGFCVAAIFTLSCDQSKPLNPEPVKKADTIPAVTAIIADPSIAGNFSTQTQLTFDSSRLDSFLKKYPLFHPYSKDLKKFYSMRRYAYAWYDNKGLIEQTEDMYNRIVNIHDEGLPQKILYMEEFRTLMENAQAAVSESGSLDPETELMISGEYFNYARNVWTGVPEEVSKKLEWFIPRKQLSYDVYLDSVIAAIQSGRTIDEPLHPQYNRLKEYLKLFRGFEKNGTWITIKGDRKKYVKGDSTEAIKEIRKKLLFSGDLANDNQSAVFDDEMETAVKSFQYRFGLKQDGIIGPGMLKELSAPLETRIRQIIVNMERARWITNEPAADYLLVNIPQFKLSVFENNQLNWDCDVVVGKEVHKTVIFQGDLKYVVFSPYWNIPPGILKNETLPAIKRDPNYLKRNNMEWNGGKVRQKPGPNNSLGLVKFLFPNSYNIYLHDTPSKPLFKEEKRAFSHGCIRVSEPRRLALYLLRNDSSWNEQKVDAAMKSGKEKYVTLKKTVPVSIVYFTAWVDEKGKLNFRDDVYKRDARLMESIFQKSNIAGNNIKK